MISPESLHDNGETILVAVLVDQDGVILGGQLPEMPASTAGLLLSDILQPQDSDDFAAWWQVQVALAREQQAHQTIARLATGGEDPQPVAVRISMIPARHEVIVACVRTAVGSEIAAYHASLVRSMEEMLGLHLLAQQVTGQLNQADILDLVVNTLRDIFRCRACVIALHAEDGDELVIRAASGVKKQWQESIRFRIGEGIAGKVAETGESIYVPDVYSEPGGLVFDPEVRSVLAVPISYNNQVIGTLNLDSKIIDAFTAKHERILTIAASQVAAALENARLYQSAAERAERLTQANLELKYLERVRDELTQNLSHELRTPLTYIKGYVSLLRDGEMGEISAEQDEALQIVYDKASAIDRLIGDVVSIEQIDEETLDREDIEINDLVQQALDSARLVHGAVQSRFELDMDPRESWCIGDRYRLNQAIDNLLSNAMKFTPADGVITLMTRVTDAGRAVEICIKDTGIGIKPEHVRRVFERFYQIKDPARGDVGGSGIGLAIVRRVAEAHGGKVWVESEYGKGSSFTIALPRIEAHTDRDK